MERELSIMNMNKKKLFIYITILLLTIIYLIVIFNLKNYFNILSLCFGKNIVLTSNLNTSICVIFCFILIFITIDILLVLYNGKIENKGLKIKNEDATHGTANWMDEIELSKVLSISNVPGIILGKYNEKVVKLPFESYFNKNICVFGSSR